MFPLERIHFRFSFKAARIFQRELIIGRYAWRTSLEKSRIQRMCSAQWTRIFE